MTVILLSNGFQAEYEAGFANGLARAGVNAVLLGSDTTLVDRLDPGVHCVNLRGSQDPSRPWRVKTVNILHYFRAYLRLVRKADSAVVHVIGLFSLRSTLAQLIEALVLRCVSRGFVLTVHNLLPHDAETRVNYVIFWFIYRLPDVLVVHTKRMQFELSRRFGVRSEKIVLMEHGIDRVAAPGSLAKAALHTRFRIHESQQIVLFFGHMAHYKGLDLLIEAFKSLPSSTNAVLLVAGYCRDAVLRMQIRTQLEPLLSAGRAFWLDGYVPEDEVLPIFQGSDMLVLPYRHIDQSGVVFMAMSTGLPVLATDVGSLAEYAVLTGGRVVPPEDHLALAAAISDMLPAAAAVNRQRVTDAARRFLWSNVVRALLPTYANLT